MSFHVRPFAESDVDPLMKLRNHVISSSLFIYENHIWDFADATNWYNELKGDGRIALTAESGGEFAGCVYFSYFRRVSASRGLVELSVFVPEKFRRQGIAQALITAMEADLQRQGFFGMVAVIDIQNTGAIRLFEEQQFQKAGIIDNAAFLRGTWRSMMLLHKQIPNNFQSTQETNS